MITFKQKGNFKKLDSYLQKVKNVNYMSVLEKYGQAGVNALANNTPIDTGLTASSWSYEIVKSNRRFTIYWKNSNIVDGMPIAVILQYGHATRNGGYVEGIDYINPSLKKVFDELADSAWEEVTSL